MSRAIYSLGSMPMIWPRCSGTCSRMRRAMRDHASGYRDAESAIMFSSGSPMMAQESLPSALRKHLLGAFALTRPVPAPGLDLPSSPTLPKRGARPFVSSMEGLGLKLTCAFGFHEGRPVEKGTALSQSFGVYPALRNAG